jgi:hypothetical protein
LVANSAMAGQWNQETGFFCLITSRFLTDSWQRGRLKNQEPRPWLQPGFERRAIEGEGLGGFARRLATNDGRERMFLRRP